MIRENRYGRSTMGGLLGRTPNAVAGYRRAEPARRLPARRGAVPAPARAAERYAGRPGGGDRLGVVEGTPARARTGVARPAHPRADPAGPVHALGAGRRRRGAGVAAARGDRTGPGRRGEA